MKNFDSPLVNVRMTGPGTKRDPNRRVVTKGAGYDLTPRPKAGLHDHAAMFADRIAGMSWERIAAKYNITGKYPASTAASILKNSRFMHNLTPDQVAAFENINKPVTGPARPAIEERITKEGERAPAGTPNPYHPGSAAASWWQKGHDSAQAITQYYNDRANGVHAAKAP